ncbi:hypothetical protein [Nocardia grenadensis]
MSAQPKNILVAHRVAGGIETPGFIVGPDSERQVAVRHCSYSVDI